MYDLKDSGNRQTFETGSRRDTNDGKPRFDLISIPALERVAEVCRKGAQKYGAQNWRLGQPVSRYYESGLRHLMQWAQGQNDEDHLAQAVWNLMAIMQVEYDVADELLYEELLDHERYDREKFFGDLADEFNPPQHTPGKATGSMVFLPNGAAAIYNHSLYEAVLQSLNDWHASFEDSEVGTSWPNYVELQSLARDLCPVSDDEWYRLMKLINSHVFKDIRTFTNNKGSLLYKLVDDFDDIPF